MSSNAGNAKDKISRIVELRKIEEENNQRLYEFFCDRVKDLDKKSNDHKEEFKRYHLAFIYLNEGRLFRLCERYLIFEDDKISGGNGKNRDTSKKKPPAYRIQEATPPSKIYELSRDSILISDFISELYINKSVVDVLVKCIDEYDPNFNGGNMPFFVFFYVKLKLKLKSEYLDKIINEKLVIEPWVIDDRNGYDTSRHIAPGFKRLSTVNRYLRRKNEWVKKYRLDNPGCTEADIRNAFMKKRSSHYSDEQKRVIIDIILNGINPRHVSLDGNLENADEIQKEILDNTPGADKGLEAYLDDDIITDRETTQYGTQEISEDMIGVLELSINDFLEKACTAEERLVLENYCEYTPDKNTVYFMNLPLNYGQYFDIVYGKEKIQSPESISEQLRSITHEEWDSDGVIRLYHRTLQKMNFHFSDISRQ